MDNPEELNAGGIDLSAWQRLSPSSKRSLYVGIAVTAVGTIAKAIWYQSDTILDAAINMVLGFLLWSCVYGLFVWDVRRGSKRLVDYGFRLNISVPFVVIVIIASSLWRIISSEYSPLAYLPQLMLISYGAIGEELLYRVMLIQAFWELFKDRRGAEALAILCSTLL